MSQKPYPPKRALQFLRWFCSADYLEEIEGDLIEVFENQHAQSPHRAKRNFYKNVIRHFRPEFIKAFNTTQNTTTMIQHNLKLTFRSFKKYKNAFFINLIGLSSGLVCALMIYLWVVDEWNIDKFHLNNDRLYQVMHNIDNPQGITTLEWTPAPLAPTINEMAPEVEYSVRTFPPGGYTFNGITNVDENRVKAKSKYVGKDFFNVFSYPLIEGNRNTLFSDLKSVVVSEEMALSLFGTNQNIVGKTLSWEQGHLAGLYQITGVFEKVTDQSSIQFDILFSLDLYKTTRPEWERWSYNDPSTYVVLRENANTSSFEDKIANLIKQYEPEAKSTLFLRKYSDQHLYSNFENGKIAGGRIEYIKLFLYIAGFIILIACINFINLSTAKASRRFKEIGVKKCIGAKRSVLITQYLGESLVISLLSSLLAIAIIYLILPVFNDITGKHLILSFDATMIWSLSAITLITGLIAGSYPALYLSGFNPITIFKGDQASGGFSAWIRKGLVTFQFIISIIMIVMVAIVYQQIDFLQTKNLGYDKDNVVKIFPGQIDDQSMEAAIVEIGKLPGVLGVTGMNGDLTNGLHNTTTGLSWPGQTEGTEIKFSDLVIGHNFFEILGMNVVEGRPFSQAYSTENEKIIFNELAIQKMGIENPVGKTVNLWGKDREIIGVVKDFHNESLYKAVEPTFFRVSKDYYSVFVKIKAGNESETLAGIQNFYKGLSNGVALDYEFLDETYQKLYESEQRISVLSRYFAVITIIISALGLFGLAAFTAERKVKEIGIRKILGASVNHIMLLLSKDFSITVLISILFSLPISYFLAEEWLSGFAYSIKPSLWIFILSGLVTFIIAWLTIASQTFKAAVANPVDSLKDE